jgi:hypothetical protein
MVPNIMAADTILALIDINGTFRHVCLEPAPHLRNGAVNRVVFRVWRLGLTVKVQRHTERIGRAVEARCRLGETITSLRDPVHPFKNHVAAPRYGYYNSGRADTLRLTTRESSR